jgi:hypothetical protein
MNLDRFIDLLDAYGADLDGWPQAELAAATALLAALPEAREAQRRAAAEDALLLRAELPEIEPSDALRQRVLAQVAGLPAAQRAAGAFGWRAQVIEALALMFPTGRSLPQLAALALALAIGISAGFTNLGLEAQETDLVSVQIASAAPLLLEE